MKRKILETNTKLKKIPKRKNAKSKIFSIVIVKISKIAKSKKIANVKNNKSKYFFKI